MTVRSGKPCCKRLRMKTQNRFNPVRAPASTDDRCFASLLLGPGRILGTTIFLALVLTPGSSRAQETPASGLYQIVSGDYTECCGIAGPRTYSLPDPDQRFIELTIEGNTAQMSILGPDAQTIFRIPEDGPRDGFTFLLTNGVVFRDHIQFGTPAPAPGPVPDQLYFGYTASNVMDELRFDGGVVTPCPGCADFFTEFQHANVVAVRTPVVTVRVSEIEICWNASSNRTYQVQYLTALTTNGWTNLGAPVQGNGALQCVADKVSPGQPRRIYRVFTAP
jgi:hypothetical protein